MEEDRKEKGTEKRPSPVGFIRTHYVYASVNIQVAGSTAHRHMLPIGCDLHAEFLEQNSCPSQLQY